MKKLTAIILSAIMLLSCAAAVSASAKDPTENFTDVKASAWYHDAVAFVCERGIMGGMSETTFAPAQNMTRAQFVTILYRLARATDTGLGETLTFRDTKKNAWYANEVGWSVKEGYVGGYDDNTFRPNAAISRQEIAKLICVFFEKTGVDTTLASPMLEKFTDAAKFPSWSKDYIEKLRTFGLIGGDANGNFNPKANASRAEVATIFRRYVENFDDPMYYAVKKLLSEHYCKSDDAVDLTIGKSSLINRDDLSDIFLDLMGLDKSTYQIVFDEQSVSDTAADFGKYLSGFSANYDFTFRIQNLDTLKVTDPETVTFNLEKTLGQFTADEEPWGYTGYTDCIRSQPLISAARNVKNAEMKDGAIVLHLGRAEDVTHGDFASALLSGVDLSFPLYDVEIENESSFFAKYFAAGTAYDKLAEGASLTTETVNFKLTCRSANLEGESRSLSYPFCLVKDAKADTRESFPADGTRFDLEGEFTSGKAAAAWLENKISDMGCGAVLVSSSGLIDKAYAALADGRTCAVPLTLKLTAGGFEYEVKYTLGLKKDFKAPDESSPAAFFVVKDGQIVSTVVASENVSKKELKAYEALRNGFFEKTGYFLQLTTDEHEVRTGLPILLGVTDMASPAALGEATSYQYVITTENGAAVAAGRTSGGNLQAAAALFDSLVVDGDDVYLPKAALGIFDRALPDVVHAYKDFTVSVYGDAFGAAGIPWPDRAGEKGQAIYDLLIEYGADEYPFSIGSLSEAEVAGARALIEKLYADGITTRLYYNPVAYTHESGVWSESDKETYEPYVREFCEAFRDMEAITQWGFYDEPGNVEDFKFCNDIVELFKKYDPMGRKVYINLGPEASAYLGDDFYDNVAEYIPGIEYFCFDRYPFGALANDCNMVTIDRMGSMSFEEYLTTLTEEERAATWLEDLEIYSNLELNRNYAIDKSVDAGMIVGPSRIGGAERTEDCDLLMKWQDNMLIAYNYRYIEQFPFYGAHRYCLLNEHDEKTWRFEMAKEYDDYTRDYAKKINDLRLDAVFHLENHGGGYDKCVTPYYPYHGFGEIDGDDAIISFFSTGEVIVTDKRITDHTLGAHELVIEGFGRITEWYDNGTHEWAPISTCPAVSGNTLTLGLSDLYLFR